MACIDHFGTVLEGDGRLGVGNPVSYHHSMVHYLKIYSTCGTLCSMIKRWSCISAACGTMLSCPIKLICPVLCPATEARLKGALCSRGYRKKIITVKTPNIGTPRPATVVVLNLKQFNFTMK